MSRTLSGLFLVGALNRPRKRKRTNRENPRTIPEQIGKISGKVPKGQKRKKKEGQVQIGKHPRLKHPRLAALENKAHRGTRTLTNRSVCRALGYKESFSKCKACITRSLTEEKPDQTDQEGTPKNPPPNHRKS